tara:strand:+ start:1283 stop:1588 length:306 start_codon:yes stop_codon:yes gene_type:complete
MKNLVIVSFPAKSESLETLKKAMKRALPDTRSFEGCISVNTFIEESTNTIHLIEDWETLDHQATYLNWRVENGLLTDLEPLLDGGAAAINVVLCGPEYKNI